MKQYNVWYGAVPFQNKTFGSWRAAVAFMKTQLDAGVIVRSVTKEEVCEEQIGDGYDD
jgi:hypothetical protein